METARSKPQIPILLFLFSFANTLGLLFAAALPELKQYFEITKNDAQDTMTIYLVGCLIGLILYAPTSNALGRKPAIYIGGCIAILGSLLCLLAIHTHSFSLLLWGRLVTAIGASCGAILTNTMVVESFSYAETKKILSYLMTGFAVLPPLGVAVGGWITDIFSWQGCFYFMLLYSIAIVGLCTYLPETIKEKQLSHFRLSKVIRHYFHQFCHPLFILYAVIVGLSGIIAWVFSAEAPFIAIQDLHMSAGRFGLYNLIPNIGLFFGGLISVHLGQKFSLNTTLGLGSFVFFLAAVSMWILFDIGRISFFSLFLLPSLVFFTTPLILSVGQTEAMNVSKEKTYASSSIYIVTYAMMLISLTVLHLFPEKNTTTIPIVYAVAGAIMVLLWGVCALTQKKKFP